MEYRDIYDIHCMKTGKITVRGEPLEDGEFCRAACVCVFDSAGRMLIQKRREDKEIWGGMWDVTAVGASRAGEDGQMTAMRELKEETGIEVDLTNVRPHLTTYWGAGFSDVFLVEKDVSLSALHLQKEEVMDAEWVTREEILNMIEFGTFIPYYPSYIQYLFDIRETRASFRLDK